MSDNGARGVWEQELLWDATPWAARILVLVELPKPCHDCIPMYTHASILWKGRSAWESLWGWAGFWPRDAPTDNQMPSVVTSSVSLQNASSMTRRKSSTAQQDPACKRLLAKLATKGVDVQNDDTWVRLSMFFANRG